MKLRTKKIDLMLSVLITSVLSACGGGGDHAGIGGSGFISSGTVTGFGSVFVNGVEFETGTSTFDIEDTDGTQQDLRIGMVVQVAGSINSDGITGNATHIQYSDDIEGPVSAISENADLTEKTFTMLGKTVIASNLDTAFEGLTYDTLAQGSVIEVSGFQDQNEQLHATYIQLKSTSFNANTVIEIKGEIRNLSGTRFEVQSVSVNASAANLNDFPGGLQDGVLVEVKGTYNVSTNTISAVEVEAEENNLSDGKEVEVEGLITRYVSNSDFDINGYAINASSAILSPASLVLKVGIKVEAEGVVSNGMLNASEIEIRGGDMEVSAKVDSISFSNNSFTVQVVSGQPSVTVSLTTATLMEDELGDNDNLLLSELNVNDFVEVRGFESATGTVTATRVKRESEVKEVKLQGVVTAQLTDVSITVLGVVFPVDAVSGDKTTYEDANEISMTNHAAFIAATTNGQTVISIVDKKAPDGNNVGVADEVEIED